MPDQRGASGSNRDESPDISRGGGAAGPAATPALGQRRDGGVIPGLAETPAFTLHLPEPSAIPVLIAVPHAGRAYPPAVLAAMRQPTDAAMRLEDRLADRIGEAVARATGAALLVARAPRAMLDLNRASDDVDWSMIAPDADGSPSGAGVGPVKPGRRAPGGLGLVPRRLPHSGEIWKARLPAAELTARIDGIHQPYHAAIADTLAALRRRWGAALLLDLHSMPPLPSTAAGEPPARYVVGDRFGASCAGALVACCFARLAGSGHLAAHNRPYAGGYALESHAQPGRGLHALQIEIDRSLYLDHRLAEPGPGLAGVVAVLIAMVRELAGEVAQLGRARAGLDRGVAEAAE